ncbi:uncharacterized protein LOC131149737 [Malania oleifera]|uniref:uncharacterized protein LOC131149737 n=1 Tax=Malania oleifera TaxID=397392 RepID=UPI0025AE9B75|nr:uncharacterized protein LOC131149737 [Malania oleifera]
MESLAATHMISATQSSFSTRYPSIPLRARTIIKRRRFRVRLSTKLSDFQDYRSFARPSRLLPATEVKICTVSSSEKIFTSLRLDGSQSLYKVELCTSTTFGSSLSDLTAGILLCLIGENNDSILQRIPASSVYPTETESTYDSDVLHFQRGSVDEFIFEGPTLGKIEAIWLGLESGQWRLGGVSLTTICRFQSPSEEIYGKEIQYIAFKYNFEADNILLGEGSNISMAELRPQLITKIYESDPFSLLKSKTPSQSSRLASLKELNEESMREYADLKLSLLLYDALLIFAGTSILSFTTGEKTALAFLAGGFGGFLYLLLLQRSIDGLPIPASNNGGSIGEIFRGFKSPVWGLALTLGFAVVGVKYFGPDDVSMAFTPKELVVGMMGFLVCKVAVVLAAFKPLQRSGPSGGE